MVVIDIEDTFFVRKEVPKSLKVNKEIIKINYMNLSPFENGDFVFFRKNSILYMWFFDRSAIERKNGAILVPESFLIYVFFSKKIGKKNAIIIKESKDKKFVLVIREGELVSQFVSKEKNDEIVDKLTRKFSLKNFKVIGMNETLDLSFFSFRDFLVFLKFGYEKFSDKRIFESLYNLAVSFMINLFITINLFTLFSYFYLSLTVSNKEKQLYSLEQSNVSLKKYFKEMVKEEKFTNEFFGKELAYPPLYSCVATISECVYKGNGFILSYHYTRDSIYIRVKAKSVSSIVKNLLNTGFFEDVKLLDTSRYSKLNNTEFLEVGEIELKLKRREYNGK